MVPFSYDKKTRDISKAVTMNKGNNYTDKTNKKFYPDYLSEIIITMLIAFELLIILVLLYPPVIGRQIDLSKPFQPVPEWYFLWLFKLVSYFPGEIIFIGTVVIPVIFIFLLICIPFFDRGPNGRLKAAAAGLIILTGFIVFTLLSILQ